MQFECPIISIKIPKIFIFLSHKTKNNYGQNKQQQKQRHNSYLKINSSM